MERLHGEILRVIVLYGRNNGLHEFQENYQIHVHSQFPSAFGHSFYDALHHLGVPEKFRIRK